MYLSMYVSMYACMYLVHPSIQQTLSRSQCRRSSDSIHQCFFHPTNHPSTPSIHTYSPIHSPIHPSIHPSNRLYLEANVVDRLTRYTSTSSTYHSPASAPRTPPHRCLSTSNSPRNADGPGSRRGKNHRPSSPLDRPRVEMAAFMSHLQQRGR